MLRPLWTMLLLAAVTTPVESASLEEALARVYDANPRLEAARAKLRAVDEGVPKARAGNRPTITAQTSGGVAYQDTSDGSGNLTMAKQSLDLRQPLYNGGETKALVGSAENAVRAERARLTAVEQDVLLEGIAAYTAVVRDRAILALAVANEERLRREVLATRDRYRFGQVTRTDVAQAETRQARAMGLRLSAEGDVETSIADYLRLVGEMPDALRPVTKPKNVPASLETALAAVDQHPGVIAARFDVDGAHDQVDAALAQLKPQLALDAQLSYAQDPSANLSRQSDASVGATLTVPIFQGGAEHARVRQTKQSVQQRRYNLDDVRRSVARDIAASWRARQTATGRIRTLDMQVRAAEIAYDGVRQETLGGTRTVLDLLDAEEEVFLAKIDRERAVREEIVTGYAVLAATGALSAASLSLPVSPYDPSAYYESVKDKWLGTGPELRRPGR